MISLEALFNPGVHELRHRISRNAAVLLGSNREESSVIFSDIKGLYDKRSKVVHTGESSVIDKDALSRLRHYVRESIKKMYLIEDDTIKLVFDVALGKGGLGKQKEGDHKTPLGDYKIKWLVSRNGPSKQNPGGLSSKVIEGKTYAVLDTELYFGDLANIRVKVLPDGTRKVSESPDDRPITREEIEIARGEKLWTDAYGGKQVFVMALDYPNKQDRAQGKTGSCIEIHASVNLEKVGYENYTGTLGCVSLYPSYAKRIYDYVNPGTPVRIIE